MADDGQRWLPTAWQHQATVASIISVPSFRPAAGAIIRPAATDIRFERM
jgi:hypothetical protein